ncbi:MAG TPA: ribbon-helix-helix domain-containing protein [Steroidobacteraceae bacterium]|jgi:predicted DNA-binding protein
MGSQKGHQVQVSLYLTPELVQRLKALSEKTRVSQAAYFREAIEDLLKKYEETKKGKK